jgi:hypothetical protein
MVKNLSIKALGRVWEKLRKPASDQLDGQHNPGDQVPGGRYGKS